MADGSVNATSKMGAFAVSLLLVRAVWCFLFLKNIIRKSSWFRMRLLGGFCLRVFVCSLTAYPLGLLDDPNRRQT
jgi:hypothetical protein